MIYEPLRSERSGCSALSKQPEQVSYRDQDAEDYHRQQDGYAEAFEHPGRSLLPMARRSGYNCPVRAALTYQ